ncbi:MAG: ferric reductase-like transmembrane domain-containing protein [Burkholderiales bacterium]|jgi:predicted ferric reductase|nr:ferric reductase-like transmembrane domain-containing protein [Burkholderiales bacterium]
MKKWITGLSLAAAAIWLVSLPEGTLAQCAANFWMTRKQATLASGFVAYVLMVAVMVLALRLSWVEQKLGGLDQAYRWHKWAGIAAAATMFVHWMMEQAPKWLVHGGLLTPPVRKHAAEKMASSDWMLLAHTTGEIFGYVMLFLVAVAVLKKIPYQWFRRSHKLFALVFLAVAFHSVALVPANLWLTPAGVAMVVVTLIGVLASVVALFGKIGGARRYRGTASALQRLPGELIDVTCTLEKPVSYLPGQFAFARFEGMKDAHPFSISSANTIGNKVRFCIKALGDDTRRLVGTLCEGVAVEIEGPYGRFNFVRGGKTPKEVWVAGGVGVTPFLARLEHLARTQETLEDKTIPAVEFYYCSQQDNALLQRVERLCRQAGVTLHVFDETRQGSLTLEKILQNTKTPAHAELWFCGPRGLGDALQNAWRAMGLPLQQFRREHFEMR